MIVKTHEHNANTRQHIEMTIFNAKRREKIVFILDVVFFCSV